MGQTTVNEPCYELLKEIRGHLVGELTRKVQEDLEVEVAKLIKKHVTTVGQNLTAWLLKADAFHSFEKDETSFVIRLGLPALMQEAYKNTSRDWMANYLLKGLGEKE